MKNKKLIIALIAFVAIIGIVAGIWFATRPKAEEGSKAFTVIVVHADGSQKTFEYKTDGDYLGPVLVEKGLIKEGSSPGMYDIVDGEKADYSVNQSYWGFFVGDDYAMQGMNDTPITDGAVYKLVYTIYVAE